MSPDAALEPGPESRAGYHAERDDVVLVRACEDCTGQHGRVQSAAWSSLT
jgi:hypothetical protein